MHVRSNFERKASTIVAERSRCPVFYPGYTVHSMRRGTEHEIQRPLFPGYFFVRCDLAHGSKNDILSVSGVVSIVNVRGRPVPVEPRVIDSLVILNGRQDLVRPHPFLREGARVVVRSGPFAGARGILVQGRGRRPSLVVSLNILGRSVGVTVDPLDLEPDPSPP